MEKEGMQLFRAFKAFIRRHRRRMWLRKKGFEILYTDPDAFRPTMMSLREICKLFHEEAYYVRLKNLIIREASKSPDKYKLVLLSVEDLDNLYLTHEGIEAFFEIFSDHFDGNMVKCLYLNMWLADVKKQKMQECRRVVRLASKEELERMLELDAVKQCPEMQEIIRQELAAR